MTGFAMDADRNPGRLHSIFRGLKALPELLNDVLFGSDKSLREAIQDYEQAGGDFRDTRLTLGQYIAVEYVIGADYKVSKARTNFSREICRSDCDYSGELISEIGVNLDRWCKEALPTPLAV